MSSLKLKSFILPAFPVAGLALMLLPSLPASAQLYNGWNYAIDSLNDGSGGSIYEIHGMSYRVSGNNIYFAISSQMPQSGNPVSGALNNSINYGDLILNFSNHNLDTQAKFTDPNVFGIRFDPNNDSLGNTSATPNHITGLYKNISVVDLTTSNSGYHTLQDYINAGFGRTTNAMGDLQDSNGDVKGYFGNGFIYPNIGSGTKIGDISLLDRTQLTSLGLDFSHFSGADPNGNFVFGFSLNRTYLPSGTFTASYFEECINDGTAIRGSNVPEPGTLALIGGLSLSGGIFLRRRKKARKAA